MESRGERFVPAPSPPLIMESSFLVNSIDTIVQVTPDSYPNMAIDMANLTQVKGDPGKRNRPSPSVTVSVESDSESSGDDFRPGHESEERKDETKKAKEKASLKAKKQKSRKLEKERKNKEEEKRLDALKKEAAEAESRKRNAEDELLLLQQEAQRAKKQKQPIEEMLERAPQRQQSQTPSGSPYDWMQYRLTMAELDANQQLEKREMEVEKRHRMERRLVNVKFDSMFS